LVNVSGHKERPGEEGENNPLLEAVARDLEEFEVLGVVEVAGKSERKGNLPNFY
jgi:hypothetical protein